MLVVFLAPDWLKDKVSPGEYSLQGEYTNVQIEEYNLIGYNVYYYPNCPRLVVDSTEFLTGKDIDVFKYVYVDMDIKDGVYKDNQDFIKRLLWNKVPPPGLIVDSGGGVHAYWQVSDLDAKSFLQLNRRLARAFKTDLAVGKIKQLMRLPGTINTKQEHNPRMCEVIHEEGGVHTAEQLSLTLPQLSHEDALYCESHFNKTYSLEDESIIVNDKLPAKFGQLLQSNQEVKDIWAMKTNDRSVSDFRLGHIMLAHGFTKDEAMSVLVNTDKAVSRAPQHRIGYAKGIIDKIGAFEDKKITTLSNSVASILKRGPIDESFVRFKCNKIIDGTHAGFKLGQVMGLVGGTGVGKTTFALNMFKWFVESNAEYVHFFVTLEQTEEEIAKRWVTMCGNNTALHEKVHVLGNHNPDGTYRNLSLKTIQNYILNFQIEHNVKIGCVVLDHIGILAKNQKNGETQGLLEICQQLKAFAQETKTFFVIQSQTNRQKAGIGDLELDKDAAFGTTTFEWYLDFMITIWMPLKRVYDKVPHLTVTAFKYCKIREKNVKLDRIQEDVRQLLIYDVDTEHYKMLTQDEIKQVPFWIAQATNLRGKDRKTDIIEYKFEGWT
jgi:ABC-type dipeptide/oligopeptide/nickel transport system ATPase component